MNKRAELGGYLVAGSIALATIMFFIVLLWEVFKEHIITPVADTALGLNSTYSNTTLANIQNTKSFSLGFDFGFDLIFVLLLMFIMYNTLKMSLEAEERSNTSFFLHLFISSLLFAVLLFFVQDVIQWFVNNYILNFLNVDLPIFEWFISSIAIVLYFWYLILLTINKLKGYFVERFF